MVLSNNEKQNTVSLIENITISTSDILDTRSKCRNRLAPSRLFERRSCEETTCLACMDSNLICILLAGNYCDDVMDALLVKSTGLE